MFCPNCGASVADDSKFCPGCGTPIAKEQPQNFFRAPESISNDIDPTPAPAPVPAPTPTPVPTPAPAPAPVPTQSSAPAAPAKVKKASGKKWGIIIGAALALVAAVVAVIALLPKDDADEDGKSKKDAFGNTYETPVKVMENYRNSKTYISYMELEAQLLNGFCKDEYSEVTAVLKKSDSYKEALEENKESFRENIAELKEEYGSNYKITCKITDKEKLDQDELEDFQNQLGYLGDSLCDYMDEWTADEVADDIGVSKSDAQKIINIYNKIGKKYKSTEITEGYELSVCVTITGSALEEPEENYQTMNVYKVDGRWVYETAFPSIMNVLG